MKTVIRIAMDHKGEIELQNMTSHLSADDLYKVIGAIEVLKHNLSKDFNFEPMGDDLVDDVRKLLDE